MFPASLLTNLLQPVAVQISRAEFALGNLFTEASPVAVLTGAGCSTASGIPDYRDRDGQWKQTPPMQFRDFMASEAARCRYWMRSQIGWPRFSAAEPNSIHHNLVRLEQAGLVSGVITQNVDGLHTRSGQKNLIDLHGRLAEVICMDCGGIFPRRDFQKRLEALNPDVNSRVNPGSVATAPDGDVFLEPQAGQPFNVPACELCGGILKPNVVFFGESLPPQRITRSFELIDNSASLLVLGSSLMVFSGFRYARHAHTQQLPLALVNHGVTRADELATLKINADCGDILNDLCQRIL